MRLAKGGQGRADEEVLSSAVGVGIAILILLFCLLARLV